MPGHLGQEAQEPQQGVTVARGQQEQQQLQRVQLGLPLQAWGERLLARVPALLRVLGNELCWEPGCCPTLPPMGWRTQQGLWCCWILLSHTAEDCHGPEGFL